jgi:hypothetical protein
MLGLPWWAWILVAVVAFVALGMRAARGWRAAFRGEFMRYLREHAPEFEVVAERDRELEVRGPDGTTGTLNLARLFEAGTGIPNDDTAARDTLFAHWVKMLRERRSLDSLDPERDRAQVMPRIVVDDMVRQLRSAIGTKGKTLTAAPIGVDGLSVVLVLDSEASVAYLSDDMLAELKLSAEEALAVAKQNLAAKMDVAAVVRSVLEGNSISVVKGGDSYDAARLLLVPGALADGQELAAAIPDRDTLVLAPAPRDGDWSAMRKMARTPAGDVLWGEPLRVTRSGMAAV